MSLIYNNKNQNNRKLKSMKASIKVTNGRGVR